MLRMADRRWRGVLTQARHWASVAPSRGGRPYGHKNASARDWRKAKTAASPSQGATTRSGEMVPRPMGELLCGIHSVRQALWSRHRRLHALYVREGDADARTGERSLRRASEEIAASAKESGVPIHAVSKWMLNHMTDDKPHQGVVLDADPIRLPAFEPHAPKDSTSRQVLLALDELHDPQNLGAILRSAHFLGCSAVLLSERNNAPVSPAVSRSSAGALEVLAAQNRVFQVPNLHFTLSACRDLGWRVAGAHAGASCTPASQLTVCPTIVVMGNEHRGIRKGIRQCCDDMVTIPGQAVGPGSLVDSLNVSVAAAILLYELLRQ